MGQKSRVKTSKGVYVVILVVALLAIIPLYRSIFVGPAIGKVKTQEGLSEVKGAQVSLKQVSTTFFTITIPSTEQLKTSNESGGEGIYAQYLYAEPAFGKGTQLGVTLAHLNEQSLEEIPFVKQRSITPDVYTRAFDSSSSISFQTQNKDEYATIWIHGSEYIAVVASGRSDNFGALKDSVDEAVRSWQWR